MTIKALTLHQPWASAIADGRKKIETRSWPPPSTLKPGDLLAIHTGKRPMRYDAEAVILASRNRMHDLPLGAIVCVCRFIEKMEFTDDMIRWMGDEERSFGCFVPGRWGWKLEVVWVPDEPIPARGHQRVWNWEVPEEFWSDILHLVPGIGAPLTEAHR